MRRRLGAGREGVWVGVGRSSLGGRGGAEDSSFAMEKWKVAIMIG